LGRTSKLCSLSDAVSAVTDGDRIAFGGFAVYQRPIAFVHELIRQKRRDLTIVGVVNANETDLLVGAGCIRRIETSYVGLENFGLARNFRRAAEAGEIEVVDYPELIAWDRFRASQENLPFWPCTFLGGSDVARLNPEIVPFTCPVTGKQLWAVPPARPDVVVVHAIMGDEYGNVAFPARRLLPQSVDVTHTRSCDKVIVTVERIVSTEEIKKHPELTEIPSFRTTHIVEVPYGAHPTAVLGIYQADDKHFRAYAEAGSTQENFDSYLAEYVYGTKDHHEYLERIGLRRLIALRNVELPA
jgi:glutaconate CoA-transferase subunit A